MPSQPASKRHTWLDVFCGRLATVLLGRAAAEASDSYLQGAAAVVTLPQWTWAPPAVAVGARGRSSTDGSPLLLPIRISWTPAPVLVVAEGQTVTARWSGVGLGHSGAGITTVSAVARQTATTSPAQPGAAPPESVIATARSERTVRRLLGELVRAGEDARWQVIAGLEPKALAAVRRAHDALAEEVGPAADGSDRLLDDLDMQVVVDRLLLGDPARPGEGPIPRLVERCLNPAAFGRVDPLRYVSSALRVDAADLVRRQIGDPHIGSKIRAAAADLGQRRPDRGDRLLPVPPAR